MIDLLVFALEEYVDYLYYKCMETMYDAWEMASGGFNNGQLVIFWQHILPELDAIAADWEPPEWPYVEAHKYAVDVETCYDSEVMYRAFSDTIERPLEKMDKIIFQAQRTAEYAKVLAAIDDFLGG